MAPVPQRERIIEARARPGLHEFERQGDSCSRLGGKNAPVGTAFSGQVHCSQWLGRPRRRGRCWRCLSSSRPGQRFYGAAGGVSTTGVFHLRVLHIVLESIIYTCRQWHG